jgi:hypothetical protein
LPLVVFNANTTNLLSWNGQKIKDLFLKPIPTNAVKHEEKLSNKIPNNVHDFLSKHMD